jgi:hypothetical protein
MNKTGALFLAFALVLLLMFLVLAYDTQQRYTQSQLKHQTDATATLGPDPAAVRNATPATRSPLDPNDTHASPSTDDSLSEETTTPSASSGAQGLQNGL